MLVNKSGRRLVIGRVNVKNGDILPGIPFTADERKGIEKFVKKGYIVEAKAEPEPVVELAVEEAKLEPVVEPVVEPMADPVVVEPVVEQPAEEVKAEPVQRSSRRRRKAADAPVKEDGVADND